MLFLFILISFFVNFSKAESKFAITYDRLKIIKNKFEFDGLNFSDDLLSGNIKKLFVQPKNVFAFEKGVFSFHDGAKMKWIINIQKGNLDENLKNLTDISLESADGALISLNELRLSDHISVKNAYLTPCKNAFCWNAGFSNAQVHNKCAIFKGAYFGIEKFRTPLIDLVVNFMPASGFLAPSFGIDEFDGLALTVPYYYFIDDKKDLIISPSFGETMGLGIKYRQLASSSIIHANLDVKYFGIKKIARGGYLNIKNEPLEDDNRLDMNLLFYSSKKHAQYWDNKENLQHRLYVPSYAYYSFKPFRVGFMDFINVDSLSVSTSNSPNYSVTVPKLIYQDRFKIGKNFLRLEGALSSYIYREDETVLTQDTKYNGSALASVGTNAVMLNSLLSKIELGLKIQQNNSSDMYAFLIESFKFPSIQLSSITAMPYIDLKFIKLINESNVKNRSGNYFLHQDAYTVNSALFENYEAQAPISTFHAGALIPYSFNKHNFELDLGVRRDSYHDYIILGGQYLNDIGYILFKDYLNNEHNFLVAAGVEKKKFGAQVEYQSFVFENQMHHKLNTILDIKIHSSFNVSMNGVYRIKPDNQLINAGAKIKFNVRCWVFSFGLNYGTDVLDYVNTSPKTRLTFAISLNGLDKFQDLTNTIQKFKDDGMNFAKEL